MGRSEPLTLMQRKPTMYDYNTSGVLDCYNINSFTCRFRRFCTCWSAGTAAPGRSPRPNSPRNTSRKTPCHAENIAGWAINFTKYSRGIPADTIWELFLPCTVQFVYSEGWHYILPWVDHACHRVHRTHFVFCTTFSHFIDYVNRLQI